MQDQPTQHQPAQRDLGREFDMAELLVLEFLLDPDYHGVWSVRELGQACGDEIRAVDAIAGLHREGLVHRSGEFVFVTRPAARCMQLAQLG